MNYKTEYKAPLEIYKDGFKSKDRLLKIYDLLERIQFNDDSAEEEFINMFLPLISKYSKRISTYEEDCQQDLLIEFHRIIHQFDLYGFKDTILQTKLLFLFITIYIGITFSL